MLRRRPRFTLDELRAMVAGVERAKNMLFGPKVAPSALNAEMKEQAWMEICHAVNNVSKVRRSVSEVRRKWCDWSSVVKRKRLEQDKHPEARNRVGASMNVNLTTTEKRVLSVIGMPAPNLKDDVNNGDADEIDLEDGSGGYEGSSSREEDRDIAQYQAMGAGATGVRPEDSLVDSKASLLDQLTNPPTYLFPQTASASSSVDAARTGSASGMNINSNSYGDSLLASAFGVEDNGASSSAHTKRKVRSATEVPSSMHSLHAVQKRAPPKHADVVLALKRKKLKLLEEKLEVERQRLEVEREILKSLREMRRL